MSCLCALPPDNFVAGFLQPEIHSADYYCYQTAKVVNNPVPGYTAAMTDLANNTK